MAGLGNLAGGSVAAVGVKVVLDADPIGIVKGFAQADTAGKKFAATLSGLENIGKSAFQSLQGVIDGFERSARRVRNAGIGLGVSLLGATYGAVQLDAAMHNVATIDDTVRHNFEQSINTAIKMSTVLPASAKEITEAWYEIASSGFYGAEGTTVLNQAVKAGVAGLSSTAEAGQALTAVLNAYGMSANKAREVSDLMFQTVNLGVLHFQDLVGVVGDSVGLASAAGVGFFEVGTALATMTRNGISASEAGTSLNRLIQNLLQPTESLQNAWSRITTIPLADALRDTAQGGLGLHGVMELLRKASAGNVQVLQSWFDEIRAARGAFALINNDGATYKQIFEGMGEATNKAGATQKAFEEQMKSTSMQFKLMMNDIKAIGLQIGDALQPIADAAIRTARLFLGAWEQIPKPLKELIAYFGAFASVASIVVGVLGTLAAKWILSVGAMMLLSRGLQALGALVAAQGAQWAVLGGQITAVGERVRAMSFGQFIMSGITAPIRLAGQAINFVGRTLVTTRPALTNFGAGLQRLGTGFQSVAQNAMRFAAVLPLLGIGLMAVLGDLTQSSREADAWVESFTSRIDADTFKGLSDGIEVIKQKAKDARDQLNQWDYHGVHLLTTDFGQMGDNLKATEIGLRGVGSALTNMLGMGHVFGDPFGDAKKAAASEAALAKYTMRMHDLATASERILDIKLYTDPQFATEYANASAQQKMDMFAGRIDLVAKAAHKLGIPIDKIYKLGPEGFNQLTRAVDELAGRSGLSLAALTKYGEGAVKVYQENEKAINKFVKGVDDAFMKGFDIAGAVTERGAAGQKQLRDFLFIYNTMAQEFVDDMAELMRRGLDPEILMQFAQAGPEASRNAIKTMLEDSTGQLIQFSNDTVAHLRDLRIRLEREARIIAAAAMDPTLDVTNALKIGDIAQYLGPRATPERIAEALGLDPATVRSIADRIKLNLAGGFSDTTTQVLNALGPVGAEIRTKMEQAANEARITDADASLIFDAFRTGGRTAATDVINNMNLATQPREILLNLLGYLETIAGLQDVQRKADETGKKNPKVKVDAETTEAEAALQRVLAYITGIPPNKQVNLNVKTVMDTNAAWLAFAQSGQNVAKGGVFSPSGVQTFAKGGMREKHVAQMAKGGTWRMWAEPETGGEAYIPLHHGRPRPRDLAILDQVSSMFGYALVKAAGGGFFDTRVGHMTSPRQNSVVNVQSNITFSGSIAGHEEFARIAQAVVDRRDRQVAIAISRKG